MFSGTSLDAGSGSATPVGGDSAAATRGAAPFSLLRDCAQFLQAFAEFESRRTGVLSGLIPSRFHEAAAAWRSVVHNHKDYHFEVDDRGGRNLVAHLARMAGVLSESVDVWGLDASDKKLLQIAWLAHDLRMAECRGVSPKSGTFTYHGHAELAAPDAEEWGKLHNLSADEVKVLSWVIRQHMHAHQGTEMAAPGQRLTYYRELDEQLRERGLRLLGFFQNIDAKSTLLNGATATAHCHPVDLFAKDYVELSKAEALEQQRKSHQAYIRAAALKSLAEAGLAENPRAGQIIAAVVRAFPWQPSVEPPSEVAIAEAARRQFALSPASPQAAI